VTHPLRVLVADDDAAIRAVLRTLLAEDAFTVEEAEDGAEALRRFMAGGADLIFSDLQMPGMGGLDLLRRVRAVDDTVAFIILTGAGTVENAVEALRLQADDYLVKRRPSRRATTTRAGTWTAWPATPRPRGARWGWPARSCARCGWARCCTTWARSACPTTC
jgi:DNA-binding NtrC family response regulator